MPVSRNSRQAITIMRSLIFHVSDMAGRRPKINVLGFVYGGRTKPFDEFSSRQDFLRHPFGRFYESNVLRRRATPQRILRHNKIILYDVLQHWKQIWINKRERWRELRRCHRWSNKKLFHFERINILALEGFITVNFLLWFRYSNISDVLQ